MSALPEIDARLRAWSERLARIDDSLLALEGEPVYEMLASKRAPLEGVTRERVQPALDALADLFEARQRLGDVFERAKDLRASMSTLAFWENDDKLRKLEQLLDGPSIHLGTQATPLSERSLLDQGARDVAISPEALLAAMTRGFDLAKSAIVAVAHAWKTLEPALEQIEREAADLGALAASLGEPEGAREVDALREHLGALRARIASDPLGVTGSIEEQLAPRVAAVRARLSAVRAHRERVMRGLARAEKQRRALGQLHQTARRARAEAFATFAGVRVPEVLADDLLDGLDAWREKLEATAARGRWASVAVGVERWNEACARYIEADEAVARAAEALVEKRREIEGRLSARRAQLAALEARGGAPDAALGALAAAAQAALAQRPLALDPAEAALHAFERAVIERARGARA